MRKLYGYTHLITIGSGAFSKVYRAFDPHLERHVALKVIPVSQRNRIGEIENESRLLAGNGLSCVPHLYDVQKHRKKVLLAMEWVNGIPLSKLLESDITDDARNAVATELLHALRQLHDSNIAHGDLKPANIIVTPDRGVVFVDFGFSFMLHHDRTYTAIRGTPAYMAPELWADARQREVDYRKADLYSLGLILDQLLEEPVPEYVSSLREIDPMRRPVDCRVVEREWRRLHARQRDENVLREIGDAIAVYTAGLLFDGARSLHLSGNDEEAYALLTESLGIWPDNVEALDFLQKRFSGPMKSGRKRNVWRLCGVAALCIGALFGAYIWGRYSSKRKFAHTVQEKFAFSEQQRLQLKSPAAGSGMSYGLQGTLRTVDDTDGMTGKLVVLLPNEEGILFVNGERQSETSSDGCFSGWFAAGSYRIEWYDSTEQRRFGETTDLLPFATKTVSLKRFESGYRNGE